MDGLVTMLTFLIMGLTLNLVSTVNKYDQLVSTEHHISAEYLEEAYTSCMSLHDGVAKIVFTAKGKYDYLCRDGHSSDEESHTFTREIKEIKWGSW